MKNEGTPICVEGLPFLLLSVLAAFASLVSGWWTLSLGFFLVTIYIAFFFRNPERLPPVGSMMVASPADGEVILVDRVVESEFLKEECQKISIFMNLFDVHVNRFPVDGTIKDISYKRGRFMPASEDRASHENERNTLLIETPRGEKIVLTQVAGLIARRIVCYPTPGTFALKGQRMGLIRFGSRCDLFVPLDAEVLVKRGERVLGGESIIARLKDDKGDEQE